MKERAPIWELPVVAFAAFAALVVLCPASLETPYWWDAAAVYVPGSRWVAENGFQAFPGVFPSLLARGHTTLFYVVTAAAFSVFGSAPPIGHAVVLGFSVLCVVYTYALGARLFGRPAGVVAAVLLVVSPLYLTMSAQVLPEVPLAALTIASLYEMSRGRHGSAAFFGVLVVLTKETGVACPLAIVGALMLLGWRMKAWRPVARPIALAMIPVVVLAGFFIWQRVAEGWWVLPFHAELFEMEHDYFAQGGGVLASMVLVDGRAIALAAAIGLGLWRWRTAPDSFAADPVELEGGELEAGKAEDPQASVAVPPRWVVVAALVLVFMANQGFFTQMWFLERYALAAHPGLAVLMAGAFVPAVPWAAARTLWAACALAVVGTVAVAGASRYAGEDYASGETTFRYLHMVEAHQQVYAILEAESEPPLVMSAWPMTSELRHPYLGWVQREYETVGIRGYQDGSDTVQGGRAIGAIVTAEGLGSHEALRHEAQELGMSLRRRAEVGGAAVELWMLEAGP